LVQIKLYTPQGSLKYQTDCAPNNGYFMIPLYEHGDFSLHIEPPAGWNFEPTQVQLHIDGKTDQCSLGKDINFKFAGFSIFGKVVSAGRNDGPEGVSVNLQLEDSDDPAEVLQTAVTTQGGRYSFSKILPGKYEVSGEHADWTLEQKSVHVVLEKDNVNVAEELRIIGYDVRGLVQSEGQGMAGITLILHSATAETELVNGCNKGSPKGYPGETDRLHVLCWVESDQQGKFVFPTLPSGQYKLVPFYGSSQFDVSPSQLDVTVDHGSVQLGVAFTINGFSVWGKVLQEPEGAGIYDVTIAVNGKDVLKTDGDGIYQLENMKTGVYSLLAKKEHYVFSPLEVKVTPRTVQFQDIVASQFAVCGRVEVVALPDGFSRDRAWALELESTTTGAVNKASTQQDGSFCFMAPRGSYTLTVMLSAADQKAGLQLSPPSHAVTVTSQPQMDILFTQFQAVVSGSVQCIESCSSVTLSLQRADQGGSLVHTQPEPSEGKTVTFSFNNVLPGKYTVTVQQEQWCWKEASLTVDIANSDIQGLVFVQTGFMLKCSLSHDISLHFSQDGNGRNVGSFDLKRGINKFCLAQPGVYHLAPKSCHQFESEVYTYNTSSPVVLTLTADHHLVTGTVVTPDRSDDLLVTISTLPDGGSVQVTPEQTNPPPPDKDMDSPEKSSEDKDKGGKSEGKKSKDKKKPKDTPAPPAEHQGPYTYQFSYWATTGEQIILKPSADQLLFTPGSTKLTVTGDSCPAGKASFTGERGMFVTGSVHPAQAGVHITVAVKPGKGASKQKEVTTQTNAAGEYRVGPFWSGTEYEVHAHLDGYVLKALPDNPHSFAASKLGQISVQVLNEEGSPLSGVLLSLSGGDYRNNNLTNQDGAFIFYNLGPKQYFFRAMMKEYKFNPTSQMIELEEGSSINVKVVGTRVSFSCYGRLTSLNGEAEPGLTVRAQGVANCSNAVEETTTDSEGGFRLRGLQPFCEYHVGLLSSAAGGQTGIPPHKVIQVTDGDVHGVQIIVLHSLNHFDLSGNVVTAENYLNTLKVVLYQEDNMDLPVHTVTLGSSSFFDFPPLVSNEQRYVLSLESTLSRGAFDYTTPSVAFTANGPFKHITLEFTPIQKANNIDVTDGSYLSLPVTLLLLLAGYHYDKAQLVNNQSAYTPIVIECFWIVGVVCVPTCLEGYQFAGPCPASFKCVDGKWSPAGGFPDCVPTASPVTASGSPVNPGIQTRAVVPPDQEGHCATWGQHNFRTFDGSVYQFKGACRYVLASDIFADTFNIHICNDRHCQPGEACSRSINIYMGDVEMELRQSEDGPLVYCDGNLLTVPTTAFGALIEKTSHFIIVRSGLGFKLWWDGQEAVFLTVSESLLGKTGGLCGKFNRDPTDDYTTLHGRLVADSATFANSWKMESLSAPCPNAPTNTYCTFDTTETYQVAVNAINLCSCLLETPCKAVVDPTPYFEACKEDVCFCATQRQGCECSSLEAYFRECSRFGVHHNWRSPDRCRKAPFFHNVD
ncbi:PREDICTED: LOW QUALITY PROTEIN: nodal modulator 1-like, partial [Branchiostoma belcheri]|uniref:LOW QUALITY PROTEIN: nodal modulator 1-like n=1 Tax=Branchiostoma belcheri TaxID=7741 RepID=A0A6P4YKQ1_BRABE